MTFLFNWVPLPSELSSLPPIHPLSGWLRTHVASLVASRCIVDQAAAAGAVIRLYVPEPALRDAVLARTVRDPSESSSDWIGGLSSRELDAIESLAIERALRVEDALDELSDEPGTRAILRIAYERDALASVQAVLWIAGCGQRLACELRRVDDAAVTNLSRITPSDAFGKDNLLSAVGSSDPDAWWGSL